MNDALVVSRLHGSGQRLHQRRRFPNRQRRTIQLLVQAAAAAEFQGEEGLALVFADLMDLHDVGMLQTGDRFRLDLEAGQIRLAGVTAGQDHLQGDEAMEFVLPGLVDDAHAAATQHAKDVIARDGGQARWSRLRTGGVRSGGDFRRKEVL